MEWILYLNPHTQGVEYLESKQCKACNDWKPLGKYYSNARRCRPCYDTYWMKRNDCAAKTPLEIQLGRAVQRANQRSRYRKSTGGDVSIEEVHRLWAVCKGNCTHCGTPLNFRWHPRQKNTDYAVLDRVDTSQNKSYRGNSVFLCWSCNDHKGAWDLVAQQDKTIRRLRNKLNKQKKRKREIRYESILIQG